MNKAFILLLVTLVQSQTDGGVLLADSSTNDRSFRSSQLEDLDDPEFPYSSDVNRDSNEPQSQPYGKRSLTSDAFTRRSSLDKNFMRFGRGDDAPQKRCGKARSRGKVSFYRFGRGLNDGFIRFGRARDNFIRFGRGGGKDGFIRFGRSRPDDISGLRENFIRFGKADKNFMRFGRGGPDEDYDDVSEETFQRLEKSRGQDNFMRFGRNGKNGTNFLRFGKSETEAEDADDNDRDVPKRRKRDAEEEPDSTVSKRSTGYFEILPENFPRRFFPILGNSFQNIGNSRTTPFFPGFSESVKSFVGGDSKRNQGGSNFIRFG